MNRIHRGSLSVFFTLFLVLAAPAAAQTGTPLTLDRALDRVLAANPELAAARLGVQADEHLARQAALRPNPELAVQWENLAGTGDLGGLQASELTIGASQTFELGGKRSRRSDLASQEARRSDWDRAGLVLDLAQQVREAFLEVWLAQEAVALAAEQKTVDEKLEREIGLRHEAGASSPIDLGRARVVVATGEIARRQAEQRLTAARRRLASLWGGRHPDFPEVAGDYEFVPDPGSIEPPSVFGDGNPDLARWRTEEALRRAELSVAESRGKPDLTLGLGLRRENAGGDVAFVVEAGMPLPFFDRNRSAVRASGLHLDQTRRLAEAADTAIGSELEIAIGERLAACQEIEILRRDILPLASDAYLATESGHRRGLFSLTDVLETRRSLFELRRTLLATLVRYHLADIRISRLVGEPIESVLEVAE